MKATHMTAHTTLERPTSTQITPSVFERNGSLFCNSRQVAEHFGKQNKDVNKAIRNQINAGAPERNFSPNLINDLSGQSIADYDLTRDGFMLLVMGFTGREAMKMKLLYVARFNEMERLLQERAPAGISVAELQATVRQAIGGIVKGVVGKALDERLTPLVRKLEQSQTVLATEARAPDAPEADPVAAAVLVPQMVLGGRKSSRASCYLSVSDVSRRAGVPVRRVNALLHKAGLQSEDRHDPKYLRWSITELGTVYGQQMNKGVILWSARVIRVVQWFDAQEGEARPFARKREAAA